jgi:uncharacterized membrane protein
MKKNVGRLDQIIRLFFGLFLLWLGLLKFQGLNGSKLGIVIAVFSVIPFTISATRSCPVFTFLHLSSIPKKKT